MANAVLGVMVALVGLLGTVLGIFFSRPQQKSDAELKRAQTVQTTLSSNLQALDYIHGLDNLNTHLQNQNSQQQVSLDDLHDQVGEIVISIRAHEHWSQEVTSVLKLMRKVLADNHPEAAIPELTDPPIYKIHLTRKYSQGEH